MNIISLGCGVQSSAMTLMAAHGELTPMPDAAVFADTGAERAETYEWLKRITDLVHNRFPVVVCNGGDLEADYRGGDEAARIPFHVGHGGLSGRQCTRNYKIRPIRRAVRKLLGVGPRSYIAPGTVRQWIGISTDEFWRVKDSGVAYVKNCHPLIDKGLSRQDCQSWLVRHDYPIPPPSACVFCPLQRRSQFASLSKNEKERVAQLDEWLRLPPQVVRFRGELFVSYDKAPFRSVDLSAGDAQGDLFNLECEGICGV